MKFEKFKRGYQLEFFILALVGLLILGFSVYAFIIKSNMLVNALAIMGGACLFIFGIFGFLRRWKKIDVVNVDGIAYKLYNKKISLLFYYIVLLMVVLCL